MWSESTPIRRAKSETPHSATGRYRDFLDDPAASKLLAAARDLPDAITAAVGELGGPLDVLQLDLAARPDWEEFGPINRVTGQPLWDRPADGAST